ASSTRSRRATCTGQSSRGSMRRLDSWRSSSPHSRTRGPSTRRPRASGTSPKRHRTTCISLRVAVVSDIHGNLAALETVLAAIESEGTDELWCLGDLVGYGARPNECCAAVKARASFCLVGNHDLAVRGTIDLAEFSGDAG